MAHSFRLKTDDDISEVLRKVEAAITHSGGSFSGNAEGGSFSGKSVLGMIRGEYVCVAGCEIVVTIKDKPFAVPYGMIESEIRKYFG